MNRVEEFDAFYDSTRQYVLHLTYALSGDLAVATAAVREAYAGTWQDWSKLRCRDPLSFVRSESWRQAVLQRSTHLLRRKQADHGDQDLLEALHELPGNARRLLVLQTIGELDPDATAREVGLTEETAASATSIARDAVERKLGATRADVEARLRGLRAVTDEVPFERPSLARRRARKRGRRRTSAIVAAGVLAAVAAGVVVTQGGPLDNATEVSSTLRERAAPPADELPIADDDMLEEQQIGRMAGSGPSWEVSDTETDMSYRDTLSTCPAHRFADPRAAAGWVRTFEPKKGSAEHAAQAMEVSQSEENAERGFRRTVRWYADCAVPRLQLMRSHSVQHKDRDTVVMELRHWEKPVRTYTVGISRSGVATSSVVHESKGKSGPGIKAFAGAVGDSLDPMCDEDDNRCSKPGNVKPSLPPETSAATGFLGVIDLPPVPKVDDVWVGTDPTGAQPNLSATQCDKAEFTGKKVRQARARTFVIPEAKDLPSAFGISQTVAGFAGPKAASAFVDRLVKKVENCADKDLSATVSDGQNVSGNGIDGKTWRLSFEVNDKKSVNYRLGIVRSGDLVTQVTFSPDKKFDIAAEDFGTLVERAGERLRTRGTSATASSSPADRGPALSTRPDND